jgi:very-short-patch-repair endonuclease
LNGESKTLEERLTEKPKQVYKETGEFRRAQMSPQISKMEEDISLLLQEKGVHGVVQQREFCLLSTRPDFYFPQKNLAVYIDGPVHEGKEDRDQSLRDLLTKRHGVRVLSLPFHGEGKAEKDGIVKAIMEA